MNYSLFFLFLGSLEKVHHWAIPDQVYALQLDAALDVA